MPLDDLMWPRAFGVPPVPVPGTFSFTWSYGRCSMCAKEGSAWSQTPDSIPMPGVSVSASSPPAWRHPTADHPASFPTLGLYPDVNYQVPAMIRALRWIALVLPLLLGPPPAPAAAARKPNVIVFLVDDMGWTDCGVQGSTY